MVTQMQVVQVVVVPMQLMKLNTPMRVGMRPVQVVQAPIDV